MDHSEGGSSAEEAAQAGAGFYHPRTILRWDENRGTIGERPREVLMTGTGQVKVRARRFDRVVINEESHWLSWYWADAGRAKMEAYHRFELRMEEINAARLARGERALKFPSDQTFLNRIEATTCWDTVAAKYGEVEADRRFKANERPIKARRRLELCMVDCTTLKTVTVIERMSDGTLVPVGRPTLIVMIDVFTRCIVGWFITHEKPSVHVLVECVKRANRPKIHLKDLFPGEGLDELYGTASTVLADNEKFQLLKSTQDAFTDAGIPLAFAGVGSPTHKGIVERFFRTINALLFRKLPGGVTFPPHIARLLDYDPSKDACLMLEDLEEFIEKALRYYHRHRVHRIIGMQPARAWRSGGLAIPTLRDPNKLDHMLGIVANPTLTTDGFVIDGIHYHDPSTTNLLIAQMTRAESSGARSSFGAATRNGSVRIKIKAKRNPADISKASVYNHVTGEYVTMPAVDQAYTKGRSMRHHKILRKFADEQNFQFSSTIERLAAHAALSKAIEDSSPHLRQAANRRALSLRQTIDSTSGQDGPANDTALLESELPRVMMDTYADQRTDSGVTVPGVRVGGKNATQKAQVTKAKNAAADKARDELRQAANVNAPRANPSAPKTDASTGWGGFTFRKAI